MCPINISSDFIADGQHTEVLRLSIQLIITAWVSKQVSPLQHPSWKAAQRAWLPLKRVTVQKSPTLKLCIQNLRGVPVWDCLKWRMSLLKHSAHRSMVDRFSFTAPDLLRSLLVPKRAGNQRCCYGRGLQCGPRGEWTRDQVSQVALIW